MRVAAICLVASLFIGRASSATVTSGPRIVEFGPTFRSGLGNLVIGSDGAIWAAESDGVVRLSRTGRVTEIRRPDDCSSCRSGDLNAGPGASFWMNGKDRLLQFTRGGVREVGVVNSDGWTRRFTAFAATAAGIYTSRGIEGGVRLKRPSGAERRLYPEIGWVQRIIPAARGGLWLLVGRHAPQYYERHNGIPERDASLDFVKDGQVTRDIAAGFLAQEFFNGPTATAPDGKLIAVVRDFDRGDAVLVAISSAGAVRVIMRLPRTTDCGGIAVADDGAVWFTEPDAGRIVRVDAAGASREYREHLPDGASPFGIAVDHDGSVWFTDSWHAAIGHLSPRDGTVRLFGNGLLPENTPSAPVVTDDGAVWFRETLTWHPRIARLATDGTLAEFVDPFFARGYSGTELQASGRGVTFAGSIWAAPQRAGRLDPDGKVSSLSLRGCLVSQAGFACFPKFRGRFALRYPVFARIDPWHFPNSVVLGPDGNIWFADDVHSLVGRVSPDGTFTFFTRGLHRWQSGPQHIAVGPDGALWFTEIRDRVGRVTMDGRITEFSTGIPFRSFVGGIVTGPDKNLWFTLYHGNELVRMTTRGVMTRFRRGIYPSRGSDEVVASVPSVDRAGRIWFNEPQGGRIARATVSRPADASITHRRAR